MSLFLDVLFCCCKMSLTEECSLEDLKNNKTFKVEKMIEKIKVKIMQIRS